MSDEKSAKLAELRAKVAAKQKELALQKQQREQNGAQQIATQSITSPPSSLPTKRPNPVTTTSTTSTTSTKPKSNPTLTATNSDQSRELVQLPQHYPPHEQQQQHNYQSHYYPPTTHHHHNQHHHGYYPPHPYGYVHAGHYYPPAVYDEYHHDQEYEDYEYDDNSSNTATSSQSTLKKSTTITNTASTTTNNNTPTTTNNNKPAFKSKSLCTAWPNCKFNDSCRFSHPTIDNIILSLFYSNIIYTPDLQFQIQTQSLSISCIDHINTLIDSFFQSQISATASSTTPTSTTTTKTQLYSALQPTLPTSLTPSSIHYHVQTSHLTTCKPEILQPLIPSPKNLLTQLNGLTSAVPFISFILDHIQKQQQFKLVKQDSLLLALGLPPLTTIFSSISSYTKSQQQQSQQQQSSSSNPTRTQVTVVPITFTIPTNLGLEPPTLSSTQQSNNNDTIDPEHIAFMFIFPPDSTTTTTTTSTTTTTQPTQLQRIHIISTLHMQTLFPQSFQLITNTNMKQFFIGSCPNINYNPNFHSSFNPINAQRLAKQSEKNTIYDDDMTISSIDGSTTISSGQSRQEDPNFRIPPVNFVHGGSIIQKDLTQNQMRYADTDIALIPYDDNNNDNNNNNHIKANNLKTNNTTSTNNSTQLPVKYQHLKPYILHRDPSTFLSYDDIIQQRFGMQIALAAKLNQRIQPQSTTSSSSSLFPQLQQQHDIQQQASFDAAMQKYRLIQQFMPTTINKPNTYFKPYTFTQMNKSEQNHAGAFEAQYSQYQRNFSTNSFDNNLHTNDINSSLETMQTNEIQAEDKVLNELYQKSRSWLENQGWKPGIGLGSNPDHALIKPLDGVIRPQRYGIGNRDDD